MKWHKQISKERVWKIGHLSNTLKILQRPVPFNKSKNSRLSWYSSIRKVSKTCLFNCFIRFRSKIMPMHFLTLVAMLHQPILKQRHHAFLHLADSWLLLAAKEAISCAMPIHRHHPITFAPCEVSNGNYFTSEISLLVTFL